MKRFTKNKIQFIPIKGRKDCQITNEHSFEDARIVNHEGFKKAEMNKIEGG